MPGLVFFNSNIKTNQFFRKYMKIESRFIWSLRNGVLFVFAWVAWVECLRGWLGTVGDMSGALA